MNAMPVSLKIRNPVWEDRDEVGRVSHRSHSISYRDFAPQGFAESQDPAEHAQFWGEFLSDESRRGRMWVADREGQIVGFAMTGTLSDDYVFVAEAGQILGEVPIAVLYAIHVEPECLRQGIGRALMSRVLEWMGRNGFETGFLDTHETNHRARQFYEETEWKRAAVALDPDETRVALYRVEVHRSVRPST